MACVGGLPVAVTDGLNFGSPEDPNVFWQFREAVHGIADAAEAMGTPVISGNVSFYNESELGAILPTPVIGMLGILPEASKRVGLAPKGERGELFLIQTHAPEDHGFGASTYLEEIHGIEDGIPVAPDLAAEKRLCAFLVDAIHDEIITAAHDCSEGGLAVTLAEMVLAKKCEFEVILKEEQRIDALLFGERPGRVVVTVEGLDEARKLVERAGESALQIDQIGRFRPGFTLGISTETQMVLWDGENLWHNHCRTIESLISSEV